MSRNLLQKLLTLLVAVSISTSLFAQQNEEGQVNRVIKLRSVEKVETPLEKISKVETSRTLHVAAKPESTLPNPENISFEEIPETLTDLTREVTRSSQNQPAERRMQSNPMPQQQNQQRYQQYQQPVQQQQFYQQQQQPLQQQQYGQRVPAVNTQWQTQNTMGTQPQSSPTPSVVTTTSPHISTRVIAPRFVNLKQPADFRIQIQNVNSTVAEDIKLIATLPAHAKFAGAKPEPTNVEGQQYEFTVASIPGGRSVEIQMQLIPTEKQDVELATQVIIKNRATTAIGVREPELHVEVSGPQQSHTGKWVAHTLSVTNTGDGIAQNIRLDTKLPAELRQQPNAQREYVLRQLAPGKTAKIVVKTMPEAAGDFKLGFDVIADGTNTETASHGLRVFQPQLQVTANGPNMNFVSRDGIYAIEIDNRGQVDVTNVQLAVAIPSGIEVTTVNRQAQVNNEGMLIWKFPKVAANSQELIQLKAVAKSAGEQVCQIHIRSNETAAQTVELKTIVQSRADVSININNRRGPVAVGGQTEFVIRVENKGSSAAEEVDVQVELPAALMPASNDAYFVSELDNSIRFDKLSIEPGTVKELRFGAVGVTQGEHVVRSVLTIGQSARRLVAEDSVFVFETKKSEVTENLKPELKR